MQAIRSDTEQRIISAATDIFVQKGKTGARMQEIADKANINKALLHYYFRSKDLLYLRVFEEEIRGFFNELIDTFQTNEDAEDFLRQFIDNYITTISHRPEVVRFILWEIEQGGDAFHRVVSSVLSERKLTELPFLTAIKKFIRTGQLRPLNPLQLMLSMLGMCAYPFIAQPLLKKILGIDVVSPEFQAARKEEIFHQLWNGIQPE